MIHFKFDSTTFDDLQSYGLHNIFNELLDFFRSEIKKGNSIRIEKRYSEEQSVFVDELKTLEDVEEFSKIYFP